MRGSLLYMYMTKESVYSMGKLGYNYVMYPGVRKGGGPRCILLVCISSEKEIIFVYKLYTKSNVSPCSDIILDTLWLPTIFSSFITS